jgi:hypothetical protein
MYRSCQNPPDFIENKQRTGIITFFTERFIHPWTGLITPFSA